MQESAPEVGSRGLAFALCTAAFAGSWLMWVVADPGFDRYHLPKELALALAALVCLLLFLRSGLQARLDGVDQLALASLSFSALSALLASSPALALRSCSLELAVTVLFLTARSRMPERRSWLLSSVVGAALGVALVALAEGHGLLPGLSREGRAPGSLLGQRNMVAHLLVLAMPCAWWLARSQQRAARALGAVASACLAAAVLLTRSRAGWLGAAAAVVVFLTLWLYQTRSAAPRERRAVCLPLVCSAIGLLSILLAPTQLAWRSSTPYADTLSHLLDTEQGSGAGRLAQYRASLGLVALHPALGVGPGNWMVEYPRVARERELRQRGHGFLHTGRLANSDWIALLTERGLVGSLCTLGFALSVVWAARRTPYFTLACATAAALLVVGALDAVLQLPAPACLSALVFAALVPRAHAPRPLGKISRLLYAALCLSLVWTSWASAQRALGLWARTRPGGGFAAMEAAVRHHGADLFARFSLAEAYALNGDCVRARPHLTALALMLPYHRAPKELGCMPESD